MPSSLLSEDQVIKLRLHITDMISRKVASLPSSKHEMVEIRNLNELICDKLPIHYVMDGANVGYNGDQTFSFDKVNCVIFNTNWVAKIELFVFIHTLFILDHSYDSGMTPIHYK